MSRRSRQSKRRINSIMSLLFLSAILLIASTYAWFSANRVVTINTITAKVTAAEGIQISLDGEKWSSSIDLSQANLDAAIVKDGGTTGNRTSTNLTYSLPENLIPVSTSGTVTSGRLDMKYGNVSPTGDQLTGVAAESDASTTKYICFDIFLKNSSSQTSDVLQLFQNSKVAISASDGVDGTGLEYSVRVGMVLYSGSQTLTASGADVRAIAAGTPKVCIWEPNNANDTTSTKHITEVVTNDRRIAAATTFFRTYTLNADASGTMNQVDTADGKYYATDEVAGVTEGGTITGLSQPYTLATAGTVASTVDLVDVSSTDANPVQLTIPGNKISKARVYIWLEGQDPDCNDTASTGRSIDISMSFTKPTTTPAPTPTEPDETNG